MNKAYLGALLIALTATFAAAADDGALKDGRRDLSAATNELHDAVNNQILSGEELANQTYHFSNEGLPATTAAFSFKLHPWAEYDAPDNKNATIATIMQEGEKALENSKSNPPDEVTEAAVRARAMFTDGKIDFGPLDENQAGVYNYKETSKDLGTIQTNDFFKVMARLMQPKLLYATIIHEARHAQDHQDGKLSPQQVKKGEVSAFHTEWAYLETISTNGQEIATTWIRLDDLAKKTHNPLAARAANYVFSILALYRTKGDEKRILEYVDHMGYQENGGRVKTSPFSS
jgi:hypothetical protein